MRKTLAMVLLSTSLLGSACKATKSDEVTRSVEKQRPEGALAQPQVISEGADPGASAGSASAHASPAVVGTMPPAPIESRRYLADVDAKAQTGGQVAGMPKGDPTAGNGFKDHGKNPWTKATEDRLSTFAADVDTASYTIGRRMLNEGNLPPAASVRPEEYVNYFKYAFPPPASTESPFAVVMDAAPSPVDPAKHILRVGVATKAKSAQERQPANLVFLVDVSGSMSSDDRLPLAKAALRVLTQNLAEGDTVSLVTYAGSTRVILPPTGMDKEKQILEAIDTLGAGGSTAMGSGLDLAYEQAMKGLKPGVISRVIVLSDGDANVGSHTYQEMLTIIEGRAKEGVTLSTIGFGMGNYQDETMEQLADKGNGNNFYIDNLGAAKKIFRDELGATLEVVAKDAKLQVDFDPALVARYRLVGYENRDIADQNFRNDKVDAGEIGAGHQVTALYEIELTAAGKQAQAPLATVRIRHKEPRGTKATEAAFPMVGGPAATFEQASSDFQFAFAAAAFADILRNGTDAEHWSLDKVKSVAAKAAGDDADKKELVALIGQAQTIKNRSASR